MYFVKRLAGILGPYVSHVATRAETLYKSQLTMKAPRLKKVWTILSLALFPVTATVQGQDKPNLRVPVEGQPLAANVTRVVQALEGLGTPLSADAIKAIPAATQRRDADELQDLVDPQVWFVVTINPESRVKVQRGPAKAILQQAGFTPALIKIVNQSTVTKELRITSPQAGQVYSGMTPLSAERMQRTHLKETLAKDADPGRFLELEMYSRPPMAPSLSGLAMRALNFSPDGMSLCAGGYYSPLQLIDLASA